MAERPEPIRGRGTRSDPPNRFEPIEVELDPDAFAPDDPPPDPRTRYFRDASRSAITWNQSADVPFDASLNPYRGCEHGCVYCLAPETPVLYADMAWRPLGEVRVGDVLVGFDERPASGAPRRLRPSRVEACWWSRATALRLITEQKEIFASPNHLWLQGGGSGWSRTDRLAAGWHLQRLSASRIRRGLPATAPDRVEAIEATGRRDLVDIQTSTGTFFAAGLATHNCYARPTHEYFGLSAGLDFETRIFVKQDAPGLLRAELASRAWQPQLVALSGVTDPYQPVERKLRLTRACLEVLAEFRNPTGIVTKSGLVARDADVLQELARHQAVSATLSITTLDPELARVLEPRAAQPRARLAALEALARAGVPVGVNVAPVIPGLNDHEIPAIVAAAAAAGAGWAAYILLRLPHGVKELFERWLEDHRPERKRRVLAQIRETRGGKLSDPRFGSRMRGEGLYAEQIRELVELARRRAGLRQRGPELSSAAFRRPGGDQLTLF
jgi:DNA repair photolyase